MRYSFQDRPVSKFGPPIWNCDKSHFSQLPCIRRHNSVISQPITMKFGTHTGGAAGEVCHLWLPCLFVCLCVCLFVCLFVRVFAKFQSVISQPFLNRSLWNLVHRYLAISRERMVVEIRDWCQNVGEYNTYNFCIWHFGLCVIVSKIERCRSSDPPYEIAINPWWRGGRGLPSLIALFGLEVYVSNCAKHILPEPSEYIVTLGPT